MNETIFFYVSETKCFTFLQISLIVDLIEDRFSYLLMHSICCDMLRWLKYIKKMKLHTDKKLEKGRIF